MRPLCAECLGAPVCVSNTIRPARCSVANENASNQGVLQGSHSCWCFIVSLSLTSQAGLGMQSGQFLISGGIGAACVRHWVTWRQLCLLYIGSHPSLWSIMPFLFKRRLISLRGGRRTFPALRLRSVCPECTITERSVHRTRGTLAALPVATLSLYLKGALTAGPTPCLCFDYQWLLCKGTKARKAADLFGLWFCSGSLHF